VSTGCQQCYGSRVLLLLLLCRNFYVFVVVFDRIIRIQANCSYRFYPFKNFYIFLLYFSFIKCFSTIIFARHSFHCSPACRNYKIPKSTGPSLAVTRQSHKRARRNSRGTSRSAPVNRNANNNSRLPRTSHVTDFQASFQPGNDSTCPSRMFVLE